MNTYTVTDTELTSIADAIKNKAGIASSLQYPNGFISAIETLGGVDVEDGIITRRISGTYENSRVTTIGSNAFSHCSRLTTVNFPACTNISSTAFRACHTLISFYLTGSSYVSLVNSNAFNSTPIGGYSASAGQYGSIYVPASMLESYKTRTNWTYFSSRFVGV